MGVIYHFFVRLIHYSGRKDGKSHLCEPLYATRAFRQSITSTFRDQFWHVIVEKFISKVALGASLAGHSRTVF